MTTASRQPTLEYRGLIEINRNISLIHIFLKYVFLSRIVIKNQTVIYFGKKIHNVHEQYRSDYIMVYICFILPVNGEKLSSGSNPGIKIL